MNQKPPTVDLFLLTFPSFSSYVVMFPKTIRPNLDTQVNVQLLDASRAAGTTVVVSLVDKNNKTIVSEMGTTGTSTQMNVFVRFCSICFAYIIKAFNSTS